MKKQVTKKSLTLAPVFLVLCMLAGCAAKTAPVWGDPQTGVILQFQMPEGRVLKYDVWGETHQVSDVMGQTIEVDMSSSNVFTVESNGLQDNNHRLTITIDDMSAKIQSTQGELIPDMSTVIGKSFEMVLSPLGKEVELIGADAIEYDMGPEGTRDISINFQDIFPNLAGRALKIGDSWPDESTVTEKTDNGEAIIQISGTNTLVGFETVDGYECVKVVGEGTGTIESKGEQQGMELVSTGELKGTSTWYFAYKEGIFVKQINEGTVEGTVDVPSQGVQIPFTRESTAEIKLVK
jgi:hypothetical protein